MSNAAKELRRRKRALRDAQVNLVDVAPGPRPARLERRERLRWFEKKLLGRDGHLWRTMLGAVAKDDGKKPQPGGQWDGWCRQMEDRGFMVSSRAGVFTLSADGEYAMHQLRLGKDQGKARRG